MAKTKEKIRKMPVYDMTGVMIRSRHSEHAEEETGSFLNRERKKTGSNHLTQMRFVNTEGEEKVTDDVAKIEELTISFYEALFNGRHDKDLHNTGEPFQPSGRYLEELLNKFSPREEAKVKLVSNVSKLEIEDAVKSCPNGKSSGLDGLPYEFTNLHLM